MRVACLLNTGHACSNFFVSPKQKKIKSSLDVNKTVKHLNSIILTQYKKNKNCEMKLVW